MRLFLPERFPLQYVGIFAGLLFVFQQLQGTALSFSVLSALFIVIAAIACNLGGGLTRPSGAYVFFYAVLGVIIGLTWKAFLWERAETHLLRPQLTMLIYVAGACGLVCATLVSRRFARRPAFLAGLVNDQNLQGAAVGCLVVDVAILVANFTIGGSAGGVLTALNQINRFGELAIMLGVTSTIRRTGGQRSINLTVVLAGSLMFVLNGLFGFSKEGMFTPIACWAVAAAAQSYRIVRSQLIVLAVLTFFLFQYLVPYAQYGRNYKGTDLAKNASVSITLLSDLTRTREGASRGDAWYGDEGTTTFYDRPQGLFDRLQIITVDDAITDVTEQKGAFGLYPLFEDVQNLVPHFIWPGKPSIMWGNVYLHEIGGVLADEDNSTGISFSPTGEAFHLARWLGVLVVAPTIWTILFLIFDSLCGDARRSPWALVQIVLFAHIAPEGLLAAPIYEYVYGTIAITFAALLSAYVMPQVGALVIGPGRRVIVSGPVRPVARRHLRVVSPEQSET